MTTLIGDSAVASEPEGSASLPSGLSRRVFGVLVGAGVAGVVGGAGLLAASHQRAGGLAPGGVETSFGTVRLVSAERQHRLAYDGGVPATGAESSAAAGPATAGPAAAGSGGEAVSVGGAAAGSAGHAGHGTIVATAPQPANMTWGDHLLLELEVQNASDGPVLFAPGQLRLKVGDAGPTVTNRDSGEAVSLEPGSAERFWISFLVPADAQSFSAEFTDPWLHSAPLQLQVPRVALRPGWLDEGGHHD
ncbi:DUF4352 domain-containing protein [Arthrobacter sp. CAU 1506]|uniref:DUF4352 domain-containing protein n=1 Tax=Arthrobacter sp. CAU 1506 TaxID=2560052 RepID=UPI0010AC86F7|nr:DUF4352 domain-containing protein [Arthrobacter sp. CAU 1506]TJY69395.1 DUF4352 domain-containing protein [Arthrobacter sp. CAU 1506]